MGLSLGDNWVQIGLGLGPNRINKKKTKTISYDKIWQLKIRQIKKTINKDNTTIKIRINEHDNDINKNTIIKT